MELPIRSSTEIMQEMQTWQQIKAWTYSIHDYNEAVYELEQLRKELDKTHS